MGKTEYVQMSKYMALEIRKANALIQKSRFDLTLQQQKILLFLISQIDPNDKEFKTYSFSIKQFCEICGIKVASGRNYQMLKSQIKKIADKSIWLDLQDREVLVRLIEKPTIIKESGKIEIRFDEDMMPFLLQLRSNYTKYELIYILRFNSKYTLRLYEYIKSIHYDELNPYSRYIELSELKRVLGAENYDSYKDFNNRVLSFAIDEINRYSDKTISFIPVKKNRAVIGFDVNINTKNIEDRILAGAETEKYLLGIPTEQKPQ